MYAGFIVAYSRPYCSFSLDRYNRPNGRYISPQVASGSGGWKAVPSVKKGYKCKKLIFPLTFVHTDEPEDEAYVPAAHCPEHMLSRQTVGFRRSKDGLETQ